MTEMEQKALGTLLSQISTDLGIVKNKVSTSEEHYREIKEQLKIVNTLNVEIYGPKDDGDGGLKHRVKILEEANKLMQEKYQQVVGINKAIGFLAMILGIVATLLSIFK